MSEDYFDVTRDNVLRYDPETISIPAGETRELPGSNSFIEILSATSDTVQVSLNNRYFFPLDIGLLIKAPPGKGYRRLFLRNTSGATNVVKVAKGIGDFVDGRLVISSTSIIKTDPIPTAFTNRFSILTTTVSVNAITNVISAGVNVNGAIVTVGSMTTGNDPTARCLLLDSTAAFFGIYDSGLGLVVPVFALAAGQRLDVSTAGACFFACGYRLL